MAFEQTNVNYAVEYAKELANVYPYLSYFSDIYNGENSAKIKPLGGKTVNIPSLTVSGAVTADRDDITGSWTRNWNNSYQAMTMSQDRKWKTLIDPLDIQETNMSVSVANVQKTFIESQKIPEMDAYCASRLAVSAGTTDTTALTAANILATWDSYLAGAANSRVPTRGLVAYMIPEIYAILKQAAGVTRFVNVDTGRAIDRNVSYLDGVKIVQVPSDIMQTAFTYTEGWLKESDAKQVNLLLVAPSAVVAPVVYNQAMVSNPSAQSEGMYLYFERYYYDVFVIANRNKGVIANIAAE